jgi:hypothetical protein
MPAEMPEQLVDEERLAALVTRLPGASAARIQRALGNGLHEQGTVVVGHAEELQVHIQELHVRALGPIELGVSEAGAPQRGFGHERLGP